METGRILPSLQRAGIAARPASIAAQGCERFKAILVVNQYAGATAKGMVQRQVEDMLRAANCDVLCTAATSPAETAEELRIECQKASPVQTRVIVVGGDGTIRTALPALIQSGIPLAIIPAGTLNTLARELRISRDLPRAVKTALYGEARAIDVGLANGEIFAAMAGIGWDAATIHAIVPARGKTRRAVFLSAWRGLRYLTQFPACRLRITTDADRFETDSWLAVAANASRYAYHLRMAPSALVDDGRLDLCLFEGASARQRAVQVLSLLVGRHANCGGARFFKSKHFRIESQVPTFVQLDGDAVFQTPVDLQVIPRALTVMVPANK